MKKITALLLVVFLIASLSISAFADSENDVYSLLTGLVNGRSFMLTVTAEDVDGLEDFLAPYVSFVCTVKQEDDTIVLDVTAEGEAYLKATANAEGVTLSTNFIEMEDVVTTWDALMPNITVENEDIKVIKIGMTGPNQELISLSFKLKGESLDDYQAEVYVGFITGPGAVYTLWDSFGAKDGSSNRDFAFTWDESEVLTEGSGTEAFEDGCIVRDDETTVYQDDEEIGTLTIHSELVIQ